MAGGSKHVAKMMIFETSVLMFVGVVQSSRSAEIDQHLILRFRFFNVEFDEKVEKSEILRSLVENKSEFSVFFARIIRFKSQM